MIFLAPSLHEGTMDQKAFFYGPREGGECGFFFTLRVVTIGTGNLWTWVASSVDLIKAKYVLWSFLRAKYRQAQGNLKKLLFTYLS
jgi:hypothetical protein